MMLSNAKTRKKRRETCVFSVCMLFCTHCVVEAVEQTMILRFRQNAFWRSRSFLLRILPVTAALRPKNTPPECFCLSYRHRHGLRGLRSKTRAYAACWRHRHSISLSIPPPKTKKSLSALFLLWWRRWESNPRPKTP